MTRQGRKARPSVRAESSEFLRRWFEGRRLGPHTLELRDLRGVGRSGWVRFQLVLVGDGKSFQPPVVEAIYSPGGRGVFPWIEVLAYQPQVQRGDRKVALKGTGEEGQLFGCLAEAIPPGGHLMVECESEPHQDTYLPLLKGAPPVATRLGRLLWQAGFRKIKFFYLSEGGWEGNQKLWAEKPLNPAMERAWKEATVEELKSFLVMPLSSPELTESATAARELLEQLEKQRASRA